VNLPNHELKTRVQADFNGVYGNVLCLSHSDTSVDEEGNTVVLTAGMLLTAYDPDIDDNGNPDNLVASGRVEPSPEFLKRHGSKWVLIIDENGVRHESDCEAHES
jgi:hypothetical protein